MPRALLWLTLQGGQELGDKVQGHCPPPIPTTLPFRRQHPPLPTWNEGNDVLNMVEVARQRGDTTWEKKAEISKKPERECPWTQL